MCLMISVGTWGGIYAHWGWSKRVCLGWVAITWLPVDGDEVLKWAAENAEEE